MPALDLSPEQIVTSARALIAKHGLERFSMRKLAAALDVNPMTIYLRFENKAALLDAVAAASLAEFEAPAASGSWADQVRDLAIGLRRHLIQDRETLRLLDDADRLSAGLLGTLDRGLELMAEVTDTPEAAVDAFRIVFWHVVGSALVAGAFDDLPGSRTDLALAFESTGGSHPHLAAHAAHFGPVDGADLFIRTTDLLIGGLAAARPETQP
ncbi:MAG: helix-turn-helix domain-containing protein [Actinomycetota bacterium]